MRFTEFPPWPETHFKPLSSSRKGKVMVYRLDHSGSQPFNHYIHAWDGICITAGQCRMCSVSLFTSDYD